MLRTVARRIASHTRHSSHSAGGFTLNINVRPSDHVSKYDLTRPTDDIPAEFTEDDMILINSLLKPVMDEFMCQLEDHIQMEINRNSKTIKTKDDVLITVCNSLMDFHSELIERRTRRSPLLTIRKHLGF